MSLNLLHGELFVDIITATKVSCFTERGSVLGLSRGVKKGNCR
jgi:hypothetical protein